MSLAPSIIETEYTDKRERHVVITVEGLNTESAAALRVIMLSHIPSVAIIAADVRENTSVIHSDYLRVRLGEVRILFNAQLLDDYYSDDIYDFSSFRGDNAIRFHLKKENKVGSGIQMLPVFAEDLMWEPFESQKYYSEEEKPHFLSRHTELLYLRPGEAVDSIYYAVRGTQQQHARFTVASSIGYKMETEVVLDESVTNAELAELFEVCPVNVFGKIPRGKTTPDIEDLVVQEDLCINCGKCLKIIGMGKKLSITTNEDVFIFYIDSVGTLNPVDIFDEALRIYNEREELRVIAFPTTMPSF